MPATAAQVFGPVTVDPDFTTTGEKTLLTMDTALPGGGRNVIIATYMPNNAFSSDPRGKFRIKKGETILYETLVVERFNLSTDRAKPVVLFAIDSAPSGNDVYTFAINIVYAGTNTGGVHVQGMVIKADDAEIAYNTSTVTIEPGTTATVISLNTNYPAGSKVVVLAYLSGHPSTPSTTFFNPGDIRLKLGETTISSNQFKEGMYRDLHQLRSALLWGGSVSSSTQTWSVEVTYSGTYDYLAYAILVAFTVDDLAFLDTASVALSNGVQVTVGNLTTALAGDVVVIAQAAAETISASDATAFNAGDVVLQMNDSLLGQIDNKVGWIIYNNSNYARSGILTLLRFDTEATNPSYQIKMTARKPSVNGEAKIVAFTMAVIEVKTITDSGTGVESVTVFANISVDESGYGAEAPGLRSLIPAGDAGLGADAPVLESAVPVSDEGAGFDFATAGFRVEFHDSGAGVEEVETAKEAKDAGSGAELVNMSRTVVDAGSGTDIIFSPQLRIPADHGTGFESLSIAVPSYDAGSGIEKVEMIKEIRDSGFGLDFIPFLGKEVGDSGLAVELPSVASRVSAADHATGADTVGIFATVHVFDTGQVAAELADVQLSIYGSVFIDDVEVVGSHSIPYKDYIRDGLPIQVQRHAVDDRVYIDSEFIGDVLVEWEDKIADVVRGRRALTVIGVVKIVD